MDSYSMAEFMLNAGVGTHDMICIQFADAAKSEHPHEAIRDTKNRILRKGLNKLLLASTISPLPGEIAEHLALQKIKTCQALYLFFFKSMETLFKTALRDTDVSETAFATIQTLLHRLQYEDVFDFPKFIVEQSLVSGYKEVQEQQMRMVLGSFLFRKQDIDRALAYEDLHGHQRFKPLVDILINYKNRLPDEVKRCASGGRRKSAIRFLKTFA